MTSHSLSHVTTAMSDTSVTLNRYPSSTTHSTPGSSDDNRERPQMKQTTRKLQPNLTRKSHTKSRKGCFTCKARKIKCGEEKPSCRNCMLKASDCSYPLPETRHSQGVLKRNSSVGASLSSTSYSFSMQDMQFFHHFLTLAYPHLPLGNDSVWIKEIPQFAGEHSYLMHAMLALGASHLGCISPNNSFEEKSLQHRGLAMTGLNRALARSKLAYGEADAMLATCYALTFQSTYMSDGLTDFVTFVRGCALTTDRIRGQQAATAFDIRPDRYYEIVKPRLRHLPPMNPLHVIGGLEGLNALKPYLRLKADFDFHRALHGIFSAFRCSSSEGYLEFVKVFGIWYNLSPEDFKILLDPGNIPAQILFAYFIATELIVTPLSVYDLPERMLGPSQCRTLRGIISWAHEIDKRVPPEWQYHLEWPKSIVSTAIAEITHMPSDGPAVLVDCGSQSCDDEGGLSGRITQASSPITT